MIHLKAPGLNVSGVSLPGFPLVVIGHNERVGWGMTNTGPDVQDLYVETFNPENPREYRRDNRSPMSCRKSRSRDVAPAGYSVRIREDS
jgi:acyl-homoserine lactone acylase PvdQ